MAMRPKPARATRAGAPSAVPPPTPDPQPAADVERLIDALDPAAVDRLARHCVGLAANLVSSYCGGLALAIWADPGVEAAQGPAWCWPAANPPVVGSAAWSLERPPSEVVDRIEALDRDGARQLARHCKRKAAGNEPGGCAGLARAIWDVGLVICAWANGQNTGRRRQRKTHGNHNQPRLWDRIMEEKRRNPGAKRAVIARNLGISLESYEKAITRHNTRRQGR
jgi:hypothetical protein